MGYSAGYSAGSTGELLRGIHWRATLAGYSAGSTGEPLWQNTRRDPLASRSGRILGGIHWRAARRDTRRDPLASRSGGILGGIHWRAALAGYWAGSTGKQLWRDTRRDPLTSCSGGILGGIHWRAALAGYWVGAWCRSIANVDSNIKSNNPFLSGGEKYKICTTKCGAPKSRQRHDRFLVSPVCARSKEPAGQDLYRDHQAAPGECHGQIGGSDLQKAPGWPLGLVRSDGSEYRKSLKPVVDIIPNDLNQKLSTCHNGSGQIR